MRRLLLLMVLLGAIASSAFTFSAGGNVSTIAVDETVRGGSVRLQHANQSWIVDSNDYWSGNYVPRFTRGVTRWPAKWTGSFIQFQARCTNLTFSDGQLPVVVDGVAVSTVTVPTGTITQTYTVGITPAGGGSTVEVWDSWSGRPGAQNTGVDGPIEACYVVGVNLPHGMSMPHPTATTAIISLGDSIMDARLPITANAPEVSHGVAGKFRFLAESHGWLFAMLDYGGATSADGLTAANYVTWIQQVVAAMGNPTTVTVWIQIGHNDWNDYAVNGGATTTPTALATTISTIASGLLSYSFVVSTPPPATSSGANIGGFTLASYGTAQLAITGPNITTVDSSTCSIVPGTDTDDGVHFNDTGVAKDVTCLQPHFPGL